MTLPIYDDKSQIPDDLKEHYVKRSDGKYEPEVEGITSLSGLLAKKDELQGKVSNHNREKRDLERQHNEAIQTLEREHSEEVNTLKETHRTALEAAEGSVRVPDGQVLLPKDKADLLAKYEPLGTPEELTTIKETATKAAEREAVEQKLTSYREAAQIAKIPNVEAFAKLAHQFDLPIEVTQVEGEGDEPEEQVYVVRPNRPRRLLTLEFIKADDDFAAFAESILKEPKATTTNGDETNGKNKKHLRQQPATGGKKDELFDNIRENAEKSRTAKQDTRSPAEKLGRKS